MKTIDLLFIAPDKNGPLHAPVAQLVLGDHAYDDEHHYLSCECVTSSELEAQVNSLKRQLDMALASAKRKFAKHDQQFIS